MEIGQWIMCMREGYWWRGEIVGRAMGETAVLLAPAYAVMETGEFGACVGGSPQSQEQLAKRDGRPVCVPLIGTVIVPCEAGEGE
jgi:hypothetical protein